MNRKKKKTKNLQLLLRIDERYQNEGSEKEIRRILKVLRCVKEQLFIFFIHILLLLSFNNFFSGKKREKKKKKTQRRKKCKCILTNFSFFFLPLLSPFYMNIFMFIYKFVRPFVPFFFLNINFLDSVLLVFFFFIFFYCFVT